MVKYLTAHAGMQHQRWSDYADRFDIEIKDRFNHGPRIYTGAVVEDAVQWLSSDVRELQKPFYLCLGLMEVHSSRWQIGEVGADDTAPLYGAYKEEDVLLPDFIPDLPGVRKPLARFYGCIEYMDRELGKLLDAMRLMGYMENTIIVFTTDHGIAANRAKTTLYDAGTEISLIVRMPTGEQGQKPGGRRERILIQNVDILPTLLEAVGSEVPACIDGRSFFPLLKDTRDVYTPHEYIVNERNWHGGNWYEQEPHPNDAPGYDPTRSVRDNRFHYIRYWRADLANGLPADEIHEVESTFNFWWSDIFPKSREPRRHLEELYDTVYDPLERNNLLLSDAHQDVLKVMRDRLDSWMTDTHDPLLDGHIPDRKNSWPEGELEKRRQVT